ncbi:MAG: hypothetical protein FJ297_01790 [Planctomycetes bacterium]|nr:hypothetical protein [Planctomycetota bacterium]
MLTVLAESPVTIGLAGCLVAAVLLVVWSQTGHRAALGAMVGVLAVTAGLIAIERIWTTDREQLLDTLDRIAEAVERKRLEDLLAFIHPDARGVKDVATAEYNHYQLDQARITQVWEATVLDAQHAVVKCNVRVVGGTRSGEIANQVVVRYLIVDFKKHGGAWKVANYSHHGPHEALRRDPPDAAAPGRDPATAF